MTRKRVLALLLAAAVLVCTAPFAAAASAAPYYEWKQYDPQWASVTLSRKNMKQVGCLATAVAMLAVQSGLRSESSFDPGQFALAMKKAGGFTADDDLLWDVIPKVVKGFRAQNAWCSLTGSQAEKTAKLKKYRSQGYQVAVAVKNGSHWVALRSAANGKAIMMDPGSTATNLFEKYPASGVYRVALLCADTPKPAATTTAAQQPAAQPSQPAEKTWLDWTKDIFALALRLFGIFMEAAKYVWKAVLV